MIIILEQIFILFLISLTGFIAFKLKAISAENNTGLVRIIIRITLPLLIFTSFAGAEITDEMLVNFPLVIASSVLSVTVLFGLSKITGAILNLNKQNKSLHSVHTMFGNVVFLGFPLLNALYPGGEGLIYAAIFQLGHDSLMWTWGIYILNSDSQTKKKKAFLHIINPNTIAFAAGVLILISKITIPEIVFNTFFSIGHTTIYISMIYVGGVLAQVSPRSLVSNLRSYLLSLNKLLIGPIIIGSTFVLLKSFGVNISQTAIICSVLQAAMPCMIIVSVLAKDMGLNDKQAVENIFVSTLLSIITLPLLFFFLEKIM